MELFEGKFQLPIFIYIYLLTESDTNWFEDGQITNVSRKKKNLTYKNLTSTGDMCMIVTLVLNKKMNLPHSHPIRIVQKNPCVFGDHISTIGCC